MARLAHLNGVSEILPGIPKLPDLFQRSRKRTAILGFHANSRMKEIPPQTTRSRRIAIIGLASSALFGNVSIGISLAQDNNGLWLDGPLPVPPVYNNKDEASAISEIKIANENGTRSFLKKGVYMANIGTKGRQLRLRKYAFDLLALGDLIGKDAWNYVRKYLCLKSTFMYYDFDKLISAAPVNDKQHLTDLANRLFDSFEKLEDAVKKHDLAQTESYYEDTSTILQEVMSRMT